MGAPSSGKGGVKTVFGTRECQSSAEEEKKSGKMICDNFCDLVFMTPTTL